MVYLQRPFLRYYNVRLFKYLLISALMLVAAACGHHEPDGGKTRTDGDVKRAILVYAVNNSSLAYDFKDDYNEMLTALSAVDNSDCRLLVYYTESDSECGIYEAVKSKGKGNAAAKQGEYEFVKRKSYRRDVPSTHPDRIADVIDYALTLFPNAAYDLIFWGHGMSWRPDFSDHQLNSPLKPKGYGGEYNPTGSQLDWTSISELANAVPDHKFQTIWFDCCYMTGIEVVYQFRNKCSTFVGYPTEVWQDGMQYDEVLPYLLRDTPDVVGGAMAFYTHYASDQEPVTVAVIDMSKIEPLADAARVSVKSGDLRPSESELLNYSRSRNWPFYDFRQFFSLTASLNGDDAAAAKVENVVTDAVVYSAAFGTNFNMRPWDVSLISGLSTHYYKATDSKEEKYYRTLDWYKRVYE